MIVGCKLLRADGSSLTDEHPRVTYLVGEWITVPGNGAYVAVTGGIDAGGLGPVLAYFECRDRVYVHHPDGVACFRRVRRYGRPVPELIHPQLRGFIALCVDSLSGDERFALARGSTKRQRGLVACIGRGLSPGQRVALAMDGERHHRVRLAAVAVGLSVAQRCALVGGEPRGVRTLVVRDAPCASESGRDELRRALLPEGDDSACARVRWTLEFDAYAFVHTLTGDVLVVGPYDDSGARSEEYEARSIQVAYGFGGLRAVPSEDPYVAKSQAIVRGMLEAAAPRASWRELPVDPRTALQGVVQWLE